MLIREQRLSEASRIRVALATFLIPLLSFSKTTEAFDFTALYATQRAFEMNTPVIYTTTGICVESAAKLQGKVQIFLPPLQDVLEWGFTGLAKNLAYIIEFQDDRAIFSSQADGLTVDTKGVSTAELRQGFQYNVTVADVSTGVQYDMAKASCHFKLGYA